MNKKKSSTRKKSAPKLVLVNLSPDEVQRLPKPHSGFEAFVEPMTAMYEANEDRLGAGVDVATTRTSAKFAAELAIEEEALKKKLKLVQDTRLYHQSISWTGTLDIYARGVAAGRTHLDIKREMSPFETFMKTGPRKKAAPTPVVATESAVTKTR